VRHVPAGYNWHPARDQLAGTDVYGVAFDDSQAWSIGWNNANVKDFLFATGDCQKWLIAGKDSVVGGYYSNADRLITASSERNFPYYAKWYRRSGAREDPWISTEHHGSAIGKGEILYGANSYGSTHAAAVLPHHDGADVYIRTLDGQPLYVRPGDVGQSISNGVQSVGNAAQSVSISNAAQSVGSNNHVQSAGNAIGNFFKGFGRRRLPLRELDEAIMKEELKARRAEGYEELEALVKEDVDTRN